MRRLGNSSPVNRSRRWLGIVGSVVLLIGLMSAAGFAGRVPAVRAKDDGALRVRMSGMQDAGTVTYEIRVSNTGAADLGGLTLSGAIPNGAAFRRQMITPLGAIPRGVRDDKAVWQIETLPAGETLGPFTYQVDVPTDKRASAFKARATVWWPDGQSQSDEITPSPPGQGGGAPVTPETPNGTTLQPNADADGVKRVALSVEPVSQTLLDAEGKTVVAQTYGINGGTPGPTLVFTIGDTVEITVTNNLPEATSIHWHGVILPNEMDGVPEAGEPSPLLQPGDSFTYRYTVQQTGTHIYHSHSDSAKQDMLGVVGALIFLPKQEAGPKVDHDYVIWLNEWKLPQDMTPEQIKDMPRGQSPVDTVNSVSAMPDWTSMEFNFFTMNGKALPSTAPIEIEKGERVRLRFYNIGMTTHPIHLHGQDFLQTEQDGNGIAPDNQPQLNTIPVAPGQTVAVEFYAVNPGVWPLHCHLAHHQTNNLSSGFGGMSTVVRIADTP